MDFIGNKYGHLIVLSSEIINHRRYCICLCNNCGNNKIIRADRLKGRISCGCIEMSIGLKNRLITFNKLYGGNSPMCHPDVLEKSVKTVQRKYGKNNVSAVEKIKKQKESTSMKNWGVSQPLCSNIIIEKRRNTLVERTGVPYYSQTEEFKYKNANTRGIREDYIDIIENKEKFIELYNRHGAYNLSKILNVCTTALYKYARLYEINDGLRSNLERSMKDWLNTLPFDFNSNKTLIYPHEIDFYCKEKKFGIELNGLYWHSEDNDKDHTYHIHKYNECLKQGITLLNIFEDEWYNKQDIIKNIILEYIGLIPIYNNKFNIKIIDKEKSNKFLEKYSIVDIINNTSSISIGAYTEDNELIGIMEFIKNKQYEYELIKYASNFKNYNNLYNNIFRYFIDNYFPISITAYSDNRLSAEQIYESLDFKYLMEHEPDYMMTDFINRYNKEEFINDNIRCSKIWDCGKKQFLWIDNK